MDTGFERWIKALNEDNNGSIIYTGDPDFNEYYLSKRRTLSHLLYGDYSLNLATKEQEYKLAADFYKNLVDEFLPKIHDFYENKKIRRANASKDRKPKPTKAEVLISREKYFYKHATYQGWLKEVETTYDLKRRAINAIWK